MSEFPPATTLLLDMDGVLAEVSKSYRSAIISTCHHYNAKSITHDIISDWKARGGCNNDWVLSLDLINTDPNGTKDLTLDQVTETFERFYQGDPSTNTPGLCDLETLIPSMETMKELRKRSKCGMAVVTGRPRSDCMKFLKLHNMEELFDCCVCMEDGPPKPDPFPLVRACELLKIEPSKAVIMVGDTPDDIRAGIACGCRGVGVATPENAEAAEKEGKAFDSGKLTMAMKDCGADIILRPGFDDLIHLFPEK
jgi:HAD superfamily hydrolase (TIGR01548 family)